MSASTKTKNYIAGVLASMTDEQKLGKISVTELCRECNINRSTFYYHFQDIQDVIQWIYHTEVTLPVREKIAGNDNPEDTSFVTRDILNSLYRRRDFYIQAIRIEGQNSLAEYILAEAKKNWTLLIDRRLSDSNIQKSSLRGSNTALLEAALEYYCQGHYAITVNWIRNGMDIKPSKLAELMDTVALQGFDKVMEMFA